MSGKTPCQKGPIVAGFRARGRFYCRRPVKGRLELHFLPPYAPDLNPDEFVWSHMKNNGVSKKPLKTNESLQSRIDHDLNKIRDNPKLVRSFFQAKSVIYAKD